MRDAWPRRNPHQAMALASLALALSGAVGVLAAGKEPGTAALVLAVAPMAFAWCELFSLSLGRPLVLAILDRPRGRGRAIAAADDGSGLHGPEWSRGGEAVDAGAFAGDGGG